MSTAWQIHSDNLIASINYHGELTDLCWPIKGENNLILRSKLTEDIYINGSLLSKDYKVNIDLSEDNTPTPSFSKEHGEIRYELKLSAVNDLLTKTYTFTNESSETQVIKLFVNLPIDFGSNSSRDTIFYDPDLEGLVAYENDVYLAVFADQSIEQYACQSPDDFNGNGARPDKNLQLTNNPVTVGKISGCLGYNMQLEPQAKANIKICYQFANSLYGLQRKLQASDTLPHKYNNALSQILPLVKTASTTLAKELKLNSEDTEKLNRLATTSIYIVLGAINTNGSVFAALDSSYFKTNGVDDYAYLWPRDASLTYLCLLRWDDNKILHNKIRQGILHINQCFGELPYLMHRYRLHNASLGSSWHPWIDDNGKSRIPLQLDQTALFVILYEQYIAHYGERIPEVEAKLPGIIKFINDQVEKGLHKPCYDLWENHFGQFLSEQAALMAALSAGVVIYSSHNVGTDKLLTSWEHSVNQLQNGLRENFLNEDGYLGRGYLLEKNEHQHIINQVDSSFHWLWQLGVLSPQDESLKLTVNVAEKRLVVGDGFARYENDHYLRHNQDYTGNPWYISTLWFAQYYLLTDKLLKAKSALSFVLKHMDNTGLLPEMADPNSGMALSVKPLIWSHVELLNLLNWKKSLIKNSVTTAHE